MIKKTPNSLPNWERTKYFEDFKEEEPWIDHTSDGKRNRKVFSLF